MKNYKTTITGILLAIIVAVQPLIETGTINWSKVLLAGAVAALGILARDGQQTVQTIIETPIEQPTDEKV